MSRIRRTLAFGLALMVSLAIVGGFFGRDVPFFDSLAHFRAHLAVILFALAVLLLFSRSVLGAIVSAAIAAYAAVTVFAYVVPQPAGTASAPAGRTALTLLQMNLKYDAEAQPAIATIEQVKPDIVTMQEINQRWLDAMNGLNAVYPYRVVCGAGHHGGVAIFSKLAFASPTANCHATDGFVAQRLDLGNGRGLTVASEHLEWPWPHRQGLQMASLGRVLPALEQPDLVSGDFNAVAWSGTVQRFAEATSTRPVHGIGPTWLARELPDVLRPLIGLPIDNILVSKDVEVLAVARQPATASDHLPVLLHFTVAPAQPAAATAATSDKTRP
ncbi:endonuclease/exonuclease/phosphatase family protein [Jiella sp. MQZ9-1]|uniref:Endonuclease/exonuclease/phosphatase family protein n=1 Tax=Jiella flava TaxID=2816857 RepID=A0A939JWG9_9HYPH|nr:endonuclease/exonuclease/phosphatase family protein [Jiella flava]MBO0662301.1 endonuclease/exonuclease/phosphatase family protein [Jiella flava]MCD2470868.1 endonuclease/exonuclease/phosphatase family protein [Jiella flava]